MVVKDYQGNVLRKGVTPKTRVGFQEFLAPYQRGKAVMEATRNWGVPYDWLEEMLEEVYLGHPLKMRAIAEARIMTDKISADIMADLLRANLVPKVYVPEKGTREAKNVLRQRMFFVRIQTMIKNRIHDLLDRHPEVISQAPEVTDLFGAMGMKWLKQTALIGEDNRLTPR